MSLHPDREIIAKLALFIEDHGGLEAVGCLDADQLKLIDGVVDAYLDDLLPQMLGGSPRTGGPLRLACES